MKITCLGCIVLSAVMSFAQAATPAQPQAAPSAPATVTGQRTINLEAKPLPAETPVISLPGLCPTKPAAGKCTTVVSRAQFDRLVATLSGGRDNPEKLPLQVKRQIASQYSDLLLLGVAGESAKLDKEPDAAEIFRVARLRAFAELYRARIQKQSQPSEEEVRKAYEENSGKYRQLTLERVVVPVKRQGDLGEAAMQKLAEDLRARAAKGAAFKELQAEAFDRAGMTSPPDTKLTVPGDSVPADQQAILQLKPGELTPVLPSTGGFFFYKLESQQQTALDAVHEQIATSLAQKKFQQEIEKLRKQYPVDLNTDFFGEALTPGMMAPGGAPVNMAPRPAAPQSQPVAPATK